MRRTQVQLNKSCILTRAVIPEPVNMYSYGDLHPEIKIRKELAEMPRVASKTEPGFYQSFGYGSPIREDGLGYQSFDRQPPTNLADWGRYLAAAFTTPPNKKELIEGIGYPQQQHCEGGITNYGRIYYGPGRYDYGMVVRPKSWFGNWFYFVWEIFHMLFVLDRNITIRYFKHFIFITLCYLPMYWNILKTAEMWNEFKKSHPQ